MNFLDCIGVLAKSPFFCMIPPKNKRRLWPIPKAPGPTQLSGHVIDDDGVSIRSSAEGDLANASSASSC